MLSPVRFPAEPAHRLRSSHCAMPRGAQDWSNTVNRQRRTGEEEMKLRRLLFSMLVIGCVIGVLGGPMFASAQDATPSPVAAPIPVIIDSDMISDDWMATL